MEQLIIKKSKEKTIDGLYVYNFENIPQGYIKVCNLFMDSDNKAIKRAEKMAGPDNYDYRIVEV